MKYTVGGLGFRSKREIEQHVRSIIDRTPVGHVLAGDDLNFVRDLFNRHPRASQKIGCGVHAIRVDLNTYWKACKMFTLVRMDGSETDVSYRACLYPPSPRRGFAEACRQAVLADILVFKSDVFDRHSDADRTVVCPLTNQRVDWHSAHVDHSHPWTFRRIVDAFLASENLNVANVELSGDGDGECQHYFADTDLRERFRAFHNDRAMLRVVAKRANLSLARREGKDRKEAA